MKTLNNLFKILATFFIINYMAIAQASTIDIAVNVDEDLINFSQLTYSNGITRYMVSINGEHYHIGNNNDGEKTTQYFKSYIQTAKAHKKSILHFRSHYETNGINFEHNLYESNPEDIGQRNEKLEAELNQKNAIIDALLISGRCQNDIAGAARHGESLGETHYSAERAFDQGSSSGR